MKARFLPSAWRAAGNLTLGLKRPDLRSPVPFVPTALEACERIGALDGPILHRARFSFSQARHLTGYILAHARVLVAKRGSVLGSKASVGKILSIVKVCVFVRKTMCVKCNIFSASLARCSSKTAAAAQIAVVRWADAYRPVLALAFVAVLLVPVPNAAASAPGVVFYANARKPLLSAQSILPTNKAGRTVATFFQATQSHSSSSAQALAPMRARARTLTAAHTRAPAHTVAPTHTPVRSQKKISISSNNPNGPLIFQPYVGARIYSAILENTLAGAKKGLSFYAVGSSDARSGPSTVAVAAAFPFSKIENVKTAGWAFGFAYGQGAFSYEQDRYVTPALRFVEAMVGRTSVEGDDPERSGFGGYFEITLRNEQLLPNSDYDQIVQTFGRQVRPDNRSLNFRFGAVSGLGGQGFVKQKPSRYFGHSFHLGISMPFLDDQSTTLHFQAKVFAYCLKEIILCGLNSELHHARAPLRLSGIEDLENQFFGGPFFQIYFQKKYMLLIAANYTVAASHSRSISSPIPIVKSSFSISF